MFCRFMSTLATFPGLSERPGNVAMNTCTRSNLKELYVATMANTWLLALLNAYRLTGLAMRKVGS